MGEESDSEGTHAFDRPQFSGVYEDVFHGKTFGSALSPAVFQGAAPTPVFRSMVLTVKG